MNPTLRGFGLFLSACVMAAVLGCGGGSGNTKPASSANSYTAPKVTAPVVTAPAGASVGSLLQYQAYTFTTSASVTTAGASIASYTWNLGDGSAVQTTTVATLTYPYLTAGTYPLSVIATDSNGQPSAAATTSVTVVATTDPITVTPLAPSASEAVSASLGSSISVTYAFNVADTDLATIAAGNIVFQANDPSATVGTALAGIPVAGVTPWTVVVTYAGASAIGTRTSSATVAVSDSLGAESVLTTFPALTVSTVPSTSLAPAVTLAAVATNPDGGSNTVTWQNDVITFNATAVDQNTPVEPLTYSWSFGEASKAGDVAATTTLAATPHTYATPGIYIVVFTADNGIPGGKTVASITVQVLPNTAPGISIAMTSPTGSLYSYEPATFTATVTDASGNVPVVTWNWGDGSATTVGNTATHQYVTSGAVTVTASADDGKGGVTSTTLPVTILANNPPVAQITTASAGSLLQTKPYTFAATATSPNAGGTITQFIWNFGDGTAAVTSAPVGTGQTCTTTVSHTFATSYSGAAAVQVQAVDALGSVGLASPAVAFTVIATSLPVVTFTAPASAVALNVAIAGTVTQTFTFTVSNPQLGQTGDTGPIPAANITFKANDAASLATASAVTYAAGVYSVTVTYTGAATGGTRASTPSAYAIDQLGVQGVPAVSPTVTINTQSANHTPVITITAPTAATSAVYTSSTETIGFTLTDADNDPLTYTVTWGDGTTTTGTTTGNTSTGVSVPLTHVYADTFAYTATTPALVTVTCTDNRADNPAVAPKTFTYNVTYNSFPTATITSPQASATLSAPVTALAIPATDPAVVVLPLNGKVTFSGSVTAPASASSVAADQTLTLNWSFPGGVPASATQTLTLPLGTVTPVEVTYAGVDNLTASKYRATLTVTDSYGRVSNAALGGVNAQTYERWIVVDGPDSQIFTLSFLYRQLSGAGGTATYSYAQTVGHGNGAVVSIFQDGINNTYTVTSDIGGTTQLPMRDDVTAWLTIPGTVVGDTSDASTYQFSIPNTSGVDPALENHPAPHTMVVADGTGFAFKSAGAPGNPQLQIVTGSGFGSEPPSATVVTAQKRRFQGSMALATNQWYSSGALAYAPNLRWIDRLSVPLNDPLTAQEFIHSSDETQGFSGLWGYLAIPEWFVMVKTDEVQDWNTFGNAGLGGFGSATAPTDLGFVVDNLYIGDVSSKHLSASALEALRAPAATGDPYDFDIMQQTSSYPGSAVMNDGTAAYNQGALALNPTPLSSPSLVGLSNLVNSDPGASGLTGGLQHIQVPYDINSTERAPLGTGTVPAPITYNAFSYRSVFAYAEYLWSSVWARPLVLNRTSLNWNDTMNATTSALASQQVGGTGVETVNVFSDYLTNLKDPDTEGSVLVPSATTPIAAPLFFYSNPTTTIYSQISPTPSWPAGLQSKVWPFAANVSPNGSSYDLSVAEGGTFDASSPVTEGSVVGTTHGVGRFYWAAFNPHYNSTEGALISRTWQSDGSTKQWPTNQGGTAADATTAWGFLPPQDTQVDKRTRAVNGTPINGTTTGYRVTWYNPTQDAAGTPVYPDFWAVQLVDNVSNTTNVFLLASNYPPPPTSGTTPTQALYGPLVTDARCYLPSGSPTFNAANNDLAGPGYCWFDVPPELQPASGHAATVTVFALKSILRAASAVTSQRVLNRSEWVQAVKTVTASYSIKPDGIDVGFAHKIPFGYPWDIAVVNGAQTPVSGN